MRSPDEACERDAGFTLAEVLVALAVFALASAALYRAIAGSWQALRRAQIETEMVEVARAQLAATGIASPLTEGLSSGATADGVSWQVEIRRRITAQQSATSATHATAYDISVTARRPADAGGQLPAIVLKTVRLGERQP